MSISLAWLANSANVPGLKVQGRIMEDGRYKSQFKIYDGCRAVCDRNFCCCRGPCIRNAKLGEIHYNISAIRRKVALAYELGARRDMC